jgi:hypothetical protein
VPSLTLSLSCLAVLMPAAPPELTYSQENGKVVLRVSGDGLEKEMVSLRYSSFLLLRLTVKGREGLEVDSVNADADEKNWKLVSQSRSGHSDKARNRQSWEFEFEPIKTGEVEAPTVSLRFREGPDAAWTKIQFEGKPVQVVAPEGTDARDLRGQLPIETLPEGKPWYRHLPLAGVIALGFGLFALLVKFALRRARTEVPVSPHERALRDLDSLESRPAASHSPDWYHTQISLIVRRYLEERFSMPASRQTTEEFFEQMHRSEHLNEAQQQILRNLLARCDLAKFTGLPPSAEECAEATELARTFVRQTVPAPSGQATPTVSSEK